MAPKSNVVTVVNVFQGKQPIGTFDSEVEAKAYIAAKQIDCRSRGIDYRDKEHAFSYKPHTVTVESEVVA